MRLIFVAAACILTTGVALAGENLPLSSDAQAVLTQLIQGRGYNCPLVKLARAEGQDAYGAVTKIRCGPIGQDGVYEALVFRVTIRPNNTYLVAPW